MCMSTTLLPHTHTHTQTHALRTHARTHAQTHARAHARTRARTDTRTRARARALSHTRAVAVQAFNNDKWMAGWVRDDLQASHYVCSWKVPNREPDMATGSFRRTAYYMIAARKGAGQPPIKCLEELGCNAKTKHKRLPLSC